MQSALLLAVVLCRGLVTLAIISLSFFLVADIYDQVSSGLHALGLSSDCVGGGRIQHNSNAKKILVYGYSMVGKKNHNVVNINS